MFFKYFWLNIKSCFNNIKLFWEHLWSLKWFLLSSFKHEFSWPTCILWVWYIKDGLVTFVTDFNKSVFLDGQSLLPRKNWKLIWTKINRGFIAVKTNVDRFQNAVNDESLLKLFLKVTAEFVKTRIVRVVLTNRDTNFEPPI